MSATQTLSKSQRTFSIGICASDSGQKLMSILELIESERFPNGLALSRIVVAASGLPAAELQAVAAAARADRRIVLVAEHRRRGKAAAINNVRALAAGDYLVLVNSDSLPSPGSISKLLEAIDSDGTIGSASALPTFRAGRSLTMKVLELMWSAHNISALELNHAQLSNHNCDELMVVRSDLMPEIPEDVINDGAYIGGTVFSKGSRIVFCNTATVSIDVPSQANELVQQRRRILFGHAQVWKRLGRPPRTVESLMVTQPSIAIGLLAKVMSARPALMLILPVAAVTESLAAALSLMDRLFSPRKHVVWSRYRK